MRRACLILFILLIPLSASWATSSRPQNSSSAPVKKGASKLAPSSKVVSRAESSRKKTAASKAGPAKKPEKDWPVLACGADLKTTAKNLQVYQSKLRGTSKKLSRAQLYKLYAHPSVLGESMTTLTPELFWDGVVVSRVSKRCKRPLDIFVKSLNTNDTVGAPKKFSDWRDCNQKIFGILMRQMPRIEACVQHGIAQIKKIQQTKKKPIHKR